MFFNPNLIHLKREIVTSVLFLIFKISHNHNQNFAISYPVRFPALKEFFMRFRNAIFLSGFGKTQAQRSDSRLNTFIRTEFQHTSSTDENRTKAAPQSTGVSNWKLHANHMKISAIQPNGIWSTATKMQLFFSLFYSEGNKFTDQRRKKKKSAL